MINWLKKNKKIKKLAKLKIEDGKKGYGGRKLKLNISMFFFVFQGDSIVRGSYSERTLQQ